MEEWKKVKGFEKYEVSNLGKVRSTTVVTEDHKGIKREFKGRILKGSITSQGYAKVILSVDGKLFQKHVHRLVAEHFILGDEYTVNHIDGNKSNNHVSNLEWLSSQNNILHAYSKGLNPNIYSHGVSDEEKNKIRSMFVPRRFGAKRIAAKLGLDLKFVVSVLRSKPLDYNQYTK